MKIKSLMSKLMEKMKKSNSEKNKIGREFASFVI